MRCVKCSLYICYHQELKLLFDITLYFIAVFLHDCNDRPEARGQDKALQA